MPRRPVSLRFVLAVNVALVASLALSGAGALVVVTTLLHDTTASAASSVESVRLAEEAEIDVLLLERSADPLVRRNLESELEGRLDAMREHVSTESEAGALRRAREAIDAYLASVRDPARPRADAAARHEAAFDALEKLVSVNVSDARAAQVRAARWNRFADRLGLLVGGFVLAVATGLILWLRLRAFAPVLALAEVMQRFGRGEQGARAPERGAAEVREMTRGFNEMADKLAAHQEAQLAFLAGVAHDLRNPLAVLKVTLDGVAPHRPLPAETRLREILTRSGKQVERLQRMIDDFLEVAKLDAGALDLRLQACDARDVVREAVVLFETTATRHPLALSLPEAPTPLVCDHHRLEQVVINLISNAMKYSPPGTSVEVAVEARGGEVEFQVRDHGVGIALADQERIFEPFRRVGLTQGTVPGAGLGLFIVKRIVEAHGGRIEVESALGRGTTFRVRLPSRGPPPAPAEGADV